MWIIVKRDVKWVTGFEHYRSLIIPSTKQFNIEKLIIQARLIIVLCRKELFMNKMIQTSIVGT